MSFYTNNVFTNEENNAWTKIYNLIEPNSRILDIGCSSGKLGKYLRTKKNTYVVGVDIDQKDIQIAKNNLDQAFVKNIEKDNLEDLGLFDYIVMADIIEHLLYPAEALVRIKKLLKPTGQIIFSIPNMANGLVRIELLKGRFEYTDWGLLDKTHLHYYDKIEIYQLFERSGYKIEKTDCTMRDIPKNILKKELNNIGLEYTEKFDKYIYSPESVIFQYIGAAIPSKKFVKNIKPMSNTPIDSINREITDIEKKFKEHLLKIDKELDRERKLHLKKENELNKILNSRSWKLLNKTKKIINRK